MAVRLLTGGKYEPKKEKQEQASEEFSFGRYCSIFNATVVY